MGNDLLNIGKDRQQRLDYKRESLARIGIREGRRLGRTCRNRPLAEVVDRDKEFAECKKRLKGCWRRINKVVHSTGVFLDDKRCKWEFAVRWE